jgi:diadenosine tetraphosphate (Ap4A) HIT family hydrolase
MPGHDTSMWTLDPQLDADTVLVKDLAVSRVLLNDDANYPWLILVPQRTGMVELIDLNEADRAALWNEIALASQALKAVTRCHKLNVAQLGNQVAQLHIHIIAREKSDAAWPNPVWGKAPRKPYETGARDALIGQLRALMP